MFLYDLLMCFLGLILQHDEPVVEDDVDDEDDDDDDKDDDEVEGR